MPREGAVGRLYDQEGGIGLGLDRGVQVRKEDSNLKFLGLESKTDRKERRNYNECL